VTADKRRARAARQNQRRAAANDAAPLRDAGALQAREVFRLCDVLHKFARRCRWVGNMSVGTKSALGQFLQHQLREPS
jgi:hypothetical protein